MFDEEYARESAREAMEALSRRIARGDGEPGDPERLATARMEVAQGRYTRALQIVRPSAVPTEEVSDHGPLAFIRRLALRV
jgi:hypothetical protein